MTTRSGTYDGLGGLAADAMLEPVSQIVLAHCPNQRRMGERVVLYGNPVTLGRQESLVLFPGGPLLDGELSRKHATISPDGSGGYQLKDLKSRNGTNLNGRRITHPSSLDDGDLIRAGSTLVVFRKEPVPQQAPQPAELVGVSYATAAARSALARHAGTVTPVLLQGESGTGKEVAANALHRLSDRSGGPFVAVNCPAIPESLWESELFGHEKGAFSGATSARKGLIQQADRGTLFLDEIGEMPVTMQAKLLRFLETGEFHRLGAGSATRVDVRVVAATNRDLPAAVGQGTFRNDLFARIAHAIVTLPRLRDRICDIPVLIRHFLLNTSAVTSVMPAKDMEKLMLHRWPLNVRELRSLVQILVSECDPRSRRLPLSAEAFRRMATYARVDGAAGSTPTSVITGKARPASQADAITLEALTQLLADCGGNVADMAKALGKHRYQVYRLLKRHNLDPDDYRES